MWDEDSRFVSNINCQLLMMCGYICFQNNVIFRSRIFIIILHYPKPIFFGKNQNSTLEFVNFWGFFCFKIAYFRRKLLPSLPWESGKRKRSESIHHFLLKDVSLSQTKNYFGNKSRKKRPFFSEFLPWQYLLATRMWGI